MRQFVLSVVLIAGCTAVPLQEPPVGSWGGQCYKSLDRDVSELAGLTAIDCGFLRLKATEAERSATQACAKDAVKSNRAFKFGYASFGDDSAFCDIAIRRPDGQMISFFFDADVTGQMGSNGNNSTVWTSLCNKIKFKPGTIGFGSFFDLQKCTEAPEIFSELASQNEA